LEREKAVQSCCLEAIHQGLVKSAHDLSEGGLAVALAECAVAGQVGAEIIVETQLAAHLFLFSESQSRIILSVDSAAVKSLAELAAKHQVPCQVMGVVGGERLVIKAQKAKVLVDLSLQEIEDKWRGAIPCLMA
jgi:phosphoribosylformylglycinamidine synthase